MRIVSIVLGVLLVCVLLTTFIYTSRGGAFILSIWHGTLSIQSSTSVVGTPWPDGVQFGFGVPTRWVWRAGWSGSLRGGWYLTVPAWMSIVAAALVIYLVQYIRAVITRFRIEGDE